jgi:hypothetical protein
MSFGTVTASMIGSVCCHDAQGAKASTVTVTAAEHFRNNDLPL